MAPIRISTTPPLRRAERTAKKRAARQDQARHLAVGVAGIALFVRSLSGVWRYGLALALGAISAGALAPLYAAPILFLTMPLLVWLLDGTGHGREALLRTALIGEAFGFGFFLCGLYWIGHAFLVDAATFGWMIPFVAVLLPAGLALFVVAALTAARAVWCEGWPRIVVLSAFWTIGEWLRGHILSGFPWNLIGYSWGSLLPMLQSTAWWGIYGLSFVTMLATSSVALAGDMETRLKGFDMRLVPAVAIVGLFLLGCAGQLRLVLHETQFVEGPKLRVVHGALDQAKIDDPTMQQPIFAGYLALTAKPGLETITHVIWPEAAVPFVLSRDAAALDAIGETLPDQTVLLTGSLRAEHDAKGERYFNTLHGLDGDGRILVTYDKSHLVPFGEYLPLAGLLERLGIAKLIGIGSFASGPGPRTLSVPGAPPFGALICYEIIFPGAVTDPVLRPGWLLNLTDDSWFGTGTGPHQHFETARVRAIEEGLPVVRAANKGISAVIDSVGRIVALSSPASVGIIDSGLPTAMPPTLYARWGDWPVAALVLLASILGVTAARKQSISKLVSRAVNKSVP